MIWETDHMVRRIYMTDQHSEIVKPSWFGELIGHYEGGDTLVIDTIGLQAKNSYHRLAAHAAYREAACRRALQAVRRRQDAERPGQGRGPRHLQRTAVHDAAWRKVPNQLLEMVCAENNGDHFGKNLFTPPQAETAGLLNERPRHSERAAHNRSGVSGLAR